YFNHTTPFSVAEKECEKGSEWLMPFTTNILTISLHQHNLTKSRFYYFNGFFSIKCYFIMLAIANIYLFLGQYCNNYKYTRWYQTNSSFK
ncbi:hypothetical protein, partial [Granulicatella sp. zg-ZJ]|uniref:hypothetical protein n=1 Tax=Granulicatella sp. zg-ZJ TaxID=2678504 RepID=UPI001967B493